MGNEKAHDISDQKLEELAQKIYSLKPQVKTILSNMADVNSALAKEDVWIIPGLGESNAALLQEEGHPISWTIPKEGGLMWLDAVAMLNSSKNPELAKQFIQYAASPKGQALASWREAFIGIPVNKHAFEFLTEEQRKLLQAENYQDAQKMASRLAIRTLPVQQTEQQWIDIWQKFKAN